MFRRSAVTTGHFLKFRSRAAKAQAKSPDTPAILRRVIVYASPIA